MRKYVIIDSTIENTIDFSKVLQSSLSTTRRSLDNREIVLKYEGVKPSFLNDLTVYSKSEIKQILSGDYWTQIENE
jgi:hypothetical protein